MLLFIVSRLSAVRGEFHYRNGKFDTVNGRHHIVIETDLSPGCPSCGVVSSHRKDPRFQRVNHIPVADPVEVLGSKYRWYCEEPACEPLSIVESIAQVSYRACATGRGSAERPVTGAIPS